MGQGIGLSPQAQLLRPRKVKLSKPLIEKFPHRVQNGDQREPDRPFDPEK